MQLDYDRLQNCVHEYLQSDDADDAWAELTNSLLFKVVGTLFMVPIGLLLVCTIVFSRLGVLIVWGLVKSLMTGEIFRSEREALLQSPERLRPMIGVVIIIGPRDHALILGTLSPETQVDLRFLARKAHEFALLYEGGADDGTEALYELLSNDVFIPWRRRAVPPEYSDHRELLLFDLELDTDEVFRAGKNVALVAAAVTLDEPDDADDADETGDPPGGRIVQLPWPVVEGAFVR